VYLCIEKKTMPISIFILLCYLFIVAYI